jgi:hypothetical protein
VVNRLIERQLSLEASPEFLSTPKELKSSLLAAVDKPTRPYRKGEFVELVHRGRSRHMSLRVVYADGFPADGGAGSMA